MLSLLEENATLKLKQLIENQILISRTKAKLESKSRCSNEFIVKFGIFAKP